MHATQSHTPRSRPAPRLSRRLASTIGGPDAESAEDYLEIARLLLAYGKTEIAKRRLKRVADQFGNTPAGAESRNLLSTIEVMPHERRPEA
jgi:hypothetical protein